MAEHPRRRASDKHWWLLPLFYVLFVLAGVGFVVGYTEYVTHAEAKRERAENQKIIASQILSCRRNRVLRLAVNDFHNATRRFIVRLENNPRASIDAQKAYADFLSDIRTVPVYNCVDEVLRLQGAVLDPEVRVKTNGG